jgi:hypothetical protein
MVVGNLQLPLLLLRAVADAAVVVGAVVVVSVMVMQPLFSCL